MRTQRWKDGFGVIEAQVDVTLLKSRPVPMRDGVRLSTDLYLPQDPEHDAWPVVLIRTPYDKHSFRDPTSHAYLFASQRYAVAVQDHRGRYESEGEFFPYTAADRVDGYDTVSWIVEQEWSTDRVGTYGCSYLGEVQAELAAMRHPNHAAAIIQGAAPYDGKGLRGFGFLRYGALELVAGFQWCRVPGLKVYFGTPSQTDRFEWFQSDEAELFRVGPELREETDLLERLSALPLVDALRQSASPPSDFALWASLEPGDDWWKGQGTVSEADTFDVPALHVGSWYDVAPTVTLSLFRLFRENAASERGGDNQYLIMAPTTHCQFENVGEETLVGKRPVGDARFPYLRTYLDWFDHFLNGADNATTSMPKVQYFAMGHGEWRSAESWPVPGTTEERWYLCSAGRANTLEGNGVLQAHPPEAEQQDSFVYDPREPVPSVSGPIFAAGDAMIEGSADQRDVESREDVLVYTSPQLAQGLEVCGAVAVVLWVASSARDTDFTAKLVDVYPDGEAYNVAEGILRARYRDGLDRARWLEPGDIYRIEIDLEATVNWFAPGHRLRLEVSSSSFPRWARNTNSGGNNFDDPEILTATNRVYTGGEYASFLHLAVRE
jgi:putative CocE/NonD family hydrolase